MLNRIIDFNRSCDEKIFEVCIQHNLPDINKDIVLLYDISDDNRTDCKSIIVTADGQWYMTRQTTSQLFQTLQDNLLISYTISKEISKKLSPFRKKIPYCYDDFFYFPIYTATNHHHWCGYHHHIDKQKVGDSLHLFFDQPLEIILPYKYSTSITNTVLFDSLIKNNQEFHEHYYQDVSTHSSPNKQLSITKFCNFLIPIVLEQINQVSPDEIDQQTWLGVIHHFNTSSK